MTQYAFHDAVEAFGRAARIRWKGSKQSYVVFDIMVHDGAFSASALDIDPVDRAPIRDVAKVMALTAEDRVAVETRRAEMVAESESRQAESQRARDAVSLWRRVQNLVIGRLRHRDRSAELWPALRAEIDAFMGVSDV